MIELQNYSITFSAIYTEMLAKIIHQERRINPVLFGVSYASFLDIRCAMGLVVGPAIPSLAILAHRLSSSALPITNREVLDRLRWRAAPTTDLRLQYFHLQTGLRAHDDPTPVYAIAEHGATAGPAPHLRVSAQHVIGVPAENSIDTRASYSLQSIDMLQHRAQQITSLR